MEDQKTHIFFNLTSKEKELIKICSKKLGISQSALIRLSVLQRARQELLILNQSPEKKLEDTIN